MPYGVEIAASIEECARISTEHPRDHRRLRSHHQRQRELQDAAAAEFAGLNGWRHSHTPFLLDALQRGGVSGGHWSEYVYDNVLDHLVYFRSRGRPYCAMALVTQPYHAPVEDAQKYAAKMKLRLHTPPNQRASFWYPGSTFFYCLTRPDAPPVRFLLEQMR